MIRKIAKENPAEWHMFGQLGQTKRYAGRHRHRLEDTSQSSRPGQ